MIGLSLLVAVEPFMGGGIIIGGSLEGLKVQKSKSPLRAKHWPLSDQCS